MAGKQKLSESGRATVVASAVALTLVILKITVGITTGAMVLIASAIDSGLDFLVSVFNHLAVRNAEKPSDERFNYGRGKIQGLASFLEGLVIALSSLVIVVSAVFKLMEGGDVRRPVAAVVVMIVSTILTSLLVVYLGRVARRTDNLVIKADALHYKMDLWTNLGILTALVVIVKTGWHAVDPIISIGIAFYIFYSSWQLIREGLEMLLDHALPEELTRAIEESIDAASDRIASYHQLKTRRSAHTYFVDIHLVFNREISLMEAHRLSDRVEKRIMSLEPDRTWVINCHLDPIDDSKRDAEPLAAAIKECSNR